MGYLSTPPTGGYFSFFKNYIDHLISSRLDSGGIHRLKPKVIHYVILPQMRYLCIAYANDGVALNVEANGTQEDVLRADIFISGTLETTA